MLFGMQLNHSDSSSAVNGDSLSTAIVLATYNGSRFLRAQLDSLLNQTRLPDQLLVRDDASTDDEATWRILELYELRFTERGVQVDMERGFDNVGYRSNFERLLRKVKTDVVFLCDQDDVWQPHKIERMMQEFAARPRLGLLFTNARLVDANGTELGFTLFDGVQVSAQELTRIHRGEAADLLLQRTLVTGATIAVRQEALADALPIPTGWVHDEWLAFVMALGNRFEIDALDEKLIDYRQHGENAIGMTAPTAGNFWTANGLRRDSQRSLALRLQRLLHNSELLRGVEPRWRHELEQRRIHAHHRGHLSRNPIKRVSAVAREALSGRYSRYALGLRSIVSDIALLK